MKNRHDIEARKAALMAVSALQRRELEIGGRAIAGRLAGAADGLSLVRRLTKQPALKLGLGALLLLAPRRWGWKLLQGAVAARLLTRWRRRS
jgi:hypothetical protein